MACCGRVFKKHVIGKILDITGEVIKAELSDKVMRSFYKLLIEESGCDMITYNSKAIYEVDMEVALRRRRWKSTLCLNGLKNQQRKIHQWFVRCLKN